MLAHSFARLRRTLSRAATPIVFAEGTPAGGEWLLPAVAASMESKRAALRAAFEKAAPTDPNLHYVNASQLWPKVRHFPAQFPPF